MKTDPNDKYGWYNLGVIAQGAGKTSTAANDYLQAHQDPTRPSSRRCTTSACCSFQSNDITDAITYLGRATVANPKDANAHWNLGLALGRHAHDRPTTSEPRSELNNALKLNPTLIKTLGTPPKTSAPATKAGGQCAAGGSGAVKPIGQAVTTTSKAS